MTHGDRHRIRRRRQKLEDSRLGLLALPRIIEDAVRWGTDAAFVRATHAGEQPGADRREWTAEYAGSLDDFIADAITRGAPPPVPAVYRGVEGVMLGAVLAIPWGGGVLSGPPDAVGRRIDAQEG